LFFSLGSLTAVDLKTYEQIKFDLAELIRAGQFALTEKEKDSNKRYDLERPWHELLKRLAEDRFTLVVAGRFSRGKSSLMNAVLGMDRLPTGIVPLTSVITYVRYGTSERVLLNYEGTRLRGEATLSELPEYVTEKCNPGNVKRIHSAEIQLPAEILRRGFFFVDTPGLGSAVFENTKTTEKFIPEIDVLILVTSYESPLSEDEMRFLHYALPSVRKLFVTVNKHDTVTEDQRGEVLQYVERSIREIAGEKASAPFSVSARDALSAKQSNDPEKLHTSGLAAFENALVEFLANHRAKLFLTSMCERTLTELRNLPTQVAKDLIAKLETLMRQVDPSIVEQANTMPGAAEPTDLIATMTVSKVSPCEICNKVLKKTMRFLAQYQYDLSTRTTIQEQHAEQGGFCPLHTWHYEQMASPRGICTAYPALLNRTAERLRRIASNGASSVKSLASSLLEPHCPACKVRQQTEDEIVVMAASEASGTTELHKLALSALCLPHLQLILRHAANESLRKHLLDREAALMERIAEDMQRYAIKHDALRRDLASSEEQEAYLQALQILVGHRSVNAIFTVRDIL
jgi:GTP-binding protein EngB required for normal cell division